ncbi:MAG: hypothetical protein MAG794_00805 [Gammaproteobacteria bacterium]|nr:hypothetical protein [Gammaproteobacteria bacterium]
MTGRSLKGLIVILVFVGMQPSQAQNSLAPTVEPDRWQNLSPDTRHEVQRQYLENLPPNKREKLRSQARRFHSMPPSEKQKLCRRFEDDRGYLPPACQKLF